MRRLIIAAATVGALLFATACAGSANSAQTSPSESATESPTPLPTDTSAPTPTYALPPLTPFSDELAAQLHAIRDKVSEIRGLPIEALAQEGVTTPEDLRQNNLDQFAALNPNEAADVENELTTLRYLGLVPKGFTAEGLAGSTDDIAGFYDFDQKTLVLIGDPNEQLSDLDTMVLAHEYTHSLQDGTYDLAALERKWADSETDEDGKTDYKDTVRCLIEGDAEFTMFKYAESVWGPTWPFVYLAGIPTPDPSQASVEGSEFLGREAYFPYDQCESFVSQLYDEGGWKEVNAAWANPPATTEQVLDIKKYHAGELGNGAMPPDLTKTDLPGWTSSDLGQFGMFDVYNYVLTLTGDENTAMKAATGWGSGRIRYYKDPLSNPRVLQLYISFDSNDDFIDFIHAFDKVLAAYGVDSTTLDPSGVKRFTTKGDQPYYGEIAEGLGIPAVELLMASDETALTLASEHLATPSPKPTN